MQNLVDYINESLMINEALNSKWLRMLVKNCDCKLDEFNRSIRWDKVTDDAFTEYDPGADYVKKLIRKIRNYNSNNLVMILSKDKSYIKYLLVYGWFIMLDSKHVFREKDTKEYEIKDFIDLLPSVVLELDNHPEYVINQDDPDSYTSRNKAKNGSIERGYDIWDNKEIFNRYDNGRLVDIAKDNINRYKEILAKKHSDDLDDNGLYEKVQDIMSKVLKFVNENQDTDKMYKRQQILSMLYSKITFNKHGQKTSDNGLLPLYNAYLESKGDLELSKAGKFTFAGADSFLKSCKTTIEAIEAVIEKINEMMKDY